MSGAVLFPLTYPPFHFLLPSFVCLVPAVSLVIAGESDERPLTRHLKQGFAFGVFAHAGVLYWIALALWRFTPLAILAFAATLLLLGAWMAVAFALVGWVRRSMRLSLLVVFPLMWTAVEWAVGHQGNLRFPWLGLGTSLTGYPTLIQVADLVGARGVTLLLALANVALALAWFERGNRRAVLRRVVVVVLGIVGAAGYGLVRERQLITRPLGDVALVQPNVRVEAKRVGVLDSIMAATLMLSAEAIGATRPALTVWPEAAVPESSERWPEWAAQIGSHARQTNTPLLVGGYHTVTSASGRVQRFNAAFLFEATGSFEEQSVYHKRYLVPMIEQVPIAKLPGIDLSWLGGFSAGEPREPFTTRIGRFGVLICYESTFENLTREARRGGARFLVNITNDAWFDRWSAPHQHAAHLVMRAIENRVGIARAANSGISGFVDPLGRRYGLTALGAKTYVTGPVLSTDVLSLYTRAGDWVGRTVLALTVGMLGLAWWRGFHRPVA